MVVESALLGRPCHELGMPMTCGDFVSHTGPSMTEEATPANGSDTPTAKVSAPAPAASAPAGFWRRLGAFLIDALLLGVVGMVVGAIFGDTLSQMGGYERIIGFALALAYAGFLNSALGGGRTLGKRALGLRVEHVDGGLLSVPRAMARQVVFSVPFFLNGAPFGESVLMSAWGYVLSAVVLGGIFSILYLYLFNRKTRRSLHDLAVGSWVVRAGAMPPVPVEATWRGHLAVVSLLVLLAAGGPLLFKRLAGTEFFAGLLELNRAMSAEPGVISANSVVGASYRSGGATTEYVAVTLQIEDRLVHDESRARGIARKVLEVYPAAASKDVVSVTLVHGFDMVIASKWNQHSFQFEPSELD